MQSHQKKSGVAVNNSVKRQKSTSSNENNSVYPENLTLRMYVRNTRAVKTVRQKLTNIK